MGRSRSRRGRGKSGGQGSGGSGKGKGKGGSRGRSSGTRGGQGKGGSGKGKGTGGSRGRSNNTRGGQSKVNRNQNKKARRTVKNIGKAFKGAAANAASAVANSSLASKYNRKTRDMSKLSPQQQRKYQRLSEKTGRDYSKRIASMKINLSADRLAKFAGFADKGWYKGLTRRFPGIRKLQINKQLYSNPERSGWHSSQRTGRGQGVRQLPRQLGGQDFGPRAIRGVPRERMGPQQDWLGSLYRTHNISGGKLDQEARDYWSNEAKTKGIDAVRQSIIDTSKTQGTYGGRKKPRHIGFGGPLGSSAALALSINNLNTGYSRAKKEARLQNEGTERQYQYDKKAYNMNKRNLAKTIAATITAGGM